MQKVVNGQYVDLTQAEIDDYNSRLAAADANALSDALTYVRARRNQLLTETDFIDLLNYPASAKYGTDNPQARSDMIAYRTALRDITNNITTVTEALNITWPTKPL